MKIKHFIYLHYYCCSCIIILYVLNIWGYLRQLFLRFIDFVENEDENEHKHENKQIKTPDLYVQYNKWKYILNCLYSSKDPVAFNKTHANICILWCKFLGYD